MKKNISGMKGAMKSSNVAKVANVTKKPANVTKVASKVKRGK